MRHSRRIFPTFPKKNVFFLEKNGFFVFFSKPFQKTVFLNNNKMEKEKNSTKRYDHID